MSAFSNYIAVGNEKLHYLKWGSGKRLLLAFHGYGDDAVIFSPLIEHLTFEYTILSIDLPHHGGSKWPDKEAFTVADLISLVRTLKNEFEVDKISLLGYSMGGRVCLSVIEQMPESIDKVVLMATDGLTVNLYYYLFTRTAAGRVMFRHMLENPALYLKAVDWLRKVNLVGPSKHKFVMHFLQTDEGRNLLLRVWPAMSGIIPPPSKVKATIKKHRIPVTIIMGLLDKIIPPIQAKKFSAGLDTVKVHYLAKGHRVFDHENAGLVAGELI